MDSSVNEVFALFERRLQVLRQLAGSLSAAKPAAPEAMISFLEHRTTEQCGWLADWARIEAEMEPRRRRWPELFAESAENGGIPGDVLAWDALPSDVRARGLEYRAQYHRLLGDLQGQSRVEAAVLRRSRRTAAALSSLLSSTDSTYAPPLAANETYPHGGGGLSLVGQPAARQ